MMSRHEQGDLGASHSLTQETTMVEQGMLRQRDEGQRVVQEAGEMFGVRAALKATGQDEEVGDKMSKTWLPLRSECKEHQERAWTKRTLVHLCPQSNIAPWSVCQNRACHGRVSFLVSNQSTGKVCHPSYPPKKIN